MPIKPVYAERILTGEKRFEFRRTAIRQNVTHIIIYSCAPVKKIVAIAEVKGIEVGSPSATWERTKHAAGISRCLFRDYFRGAKKACAIEIKKIKQLKRPLSTDEINNGFNVPQSFSYVDHNFFNKVIRKGSEK